MLLQRVACTQFLSSPSILPRRQVIFLLFSLPSTKSVLSFVAKFSDEVIVWKVFSSTVLSKLAVDIRMLLQLDALSYFIFNFHDVKGHTLHDYSHTFRPLWTSSPVDLMLNTKAKGLLYR